MVRSSNYFYYYYYFISIVKNVEKFKENIYPSHQLLAA